MDMKHADDIHDSFRAYQGRLLREYSAMAEEFGFRVIDGRRRIETIQNDLRRQVEAFLSGEG
jgi:thymidylate kinase